MTSLVVFIVAVIAFTAGGLAVALIALNVEHDAYQAGRRDGWRACDRHHRNHNAWELHR